MFGAHQVQQSWCESTECRVWGLPEAYSISVITPQELSYYVD